MRHAQLGWLTAGILFAMTASATGANWSLGDVTEQKCRDKGGGTFNIKYCHNCSNAAGNQPYVSWIFVAKCAGKVTKRRVRGELKCIAGQYGDENSQKTTITANARGALPGGNVACPK